MCVKVGIIASGGFGMHFFVVGIIEMRVHPLVLPLNKHTLKERESERLKDTCSYLISQAQLAIQTQQLSIQTNQRNKKERENREKISERERARERHRKISRYIERALKLNVLWVLNISKSVEVVKFRKTSNHLSVKPQMIIVDYSAMGLLLSQYRLNGMCIVIIRQNGSITSLDYQYNRLNMYIYMYMYMYIHVCIEYNSWCEYKRTL